MDQYTENCFLEVVSAVVAGSSEHLRGKQRNTARCAVADDRVSEFTFYYSERMAFRFFLRFSPSRIPQVRPNPMACAFLR